jgi:sugar phosphate isomerase/epimerase
MRISLGSWAFCFGPYAHQPISFDKTAKRLSAAGYDGIEICGFAPHVTLDRYPTRGARRELVAFLEDLELGVSGYAPDLTEVNPVIAEKKRAYLELFRRNVEMCADIGSPVIRVDTVAGPDSIKDEDYRAAFDRVADTWAEAAEIALQSKVRIAWEFEPGFAFNKPSEIVALHKKIGHPNFTILFDTTHAYMCGVVGARQHGSKEIVRGGVVGFLNKIEGRIGHIHLIDSDGSLHNGETSVHRPFGEGSIDFGALAPRLLAVPGIDWWCVDLCYWPGSWELIEPSREFVANLLKDREVAQAN